jgi:hypothetical protein
MCFRAFFVLAAFLGGIAFAATVPSIDELNGKYMQWIGKQNRKSEWNNVSGIFVIHKWFVFKVENLVNTYFFPTKTKEDWMNEWMNECMNDGMNES